MEEGAHKEKLLHHDEYTASNSSLHPSLDLQLSINVPWDVKDANKYSCVEALQSQTAEQTRLAAMEKAYAERVRELTRREMELANTDFRRARTVWERARQELDRAQKLKERATADSPNFMDITCPSCRQRFKPT